MVVRISCIGCQQLREKIVCPLTAVFVYPRSGNDASWATVQVTKTKTKKKNAEIKSLVLRQLSDRIMQCGGAQNINFRLFLIRWVLLLIAVLLSVTVPHRVQGFSYPTHLNSSWSEWLLDRFSLSQHLNRSDQQQQVLYTQVAPLAASQRPRLPQFVTFNTLDNTMTVGQSWSIQVPQVLKEIYRFRWISILPFRSWGYPSPTLRI